MPGAVMRLLGLILGAGGLGLCMAGAILTLAPTATPLTAPLTAPLARGATPTKQLALLEPAVDRALAPRPRSRVDRALRTLWERVSRRYPGREDADLIVIDVHAERLYLLHRGQVAEDWPVSTSRRGIDQVAHSDGTPVGVFRIAREIGAGLPADEVLRDQAPTGRIVTPVRSPDDPAASRWITTRILWLSGLQPGWNKGGDCDTFLRHIYIHGTANLGMLGRPASLGCVQMAPRAVMALYRAAPVGTPVLITPGTGRLSAIPGPAVS
jgi:L,D-transpeptidase catalytic domain